jgi:hypothetical protein
MSVFKYGLCYCGVKLTEALEVQLLFEQIVQRVAVLASVAVVDLVVGAHDGSGASSNGICKGPVKLSS